MPFPSLGSDIDFNKVTPVWSGSASTLYLDYADNPAGLYIFQGIVIGYLIPNQGGNFFFHGANSAGYLFTRYVEITAEATRWKIRRFVFSQLGNGYENMSLVEKIG
jgi:hypothetical protein